jgi:hypothetical protein
VIVHNLYILGSSIPTEADAPLVVDPDAVLPHPVPSQRLKPIAWRDPQIVEPDRCVEQLQLSPGNPFERSKPPDCEVAEEAFGASIAKALDHAKR